MQQNPTSPSMRKRQRTLDMHSGNANPVDQHPPPQSGGPVPEDAFINDHDAADSAGEEDEDEDKPKSDKKAGRRKIKIEFIQDKSRRHITFSKRKAGIMKKAYELSTLTGTQVLLLVVSETGLVYTFTTAKLQPLVTQPEGKNLIQACLNAPHGSLPSSMPVGPPIGRTSGPMIPPVPPPPSNLPGGLSIGSQNPGNLSKDDADDDHDDDAATHGGRPNAGDKRRRRASSTTGPPPGSAGSRGQTSPHSPNAAVPPPLNIPPGSQPGSQQHSSHQQSNAQSQIALGSPTSPQQQHTQVPASSTQYSSGSYGHHPGQQPAHHQQHDAGMYSGHMMSPGAYSYPPPGGPNAQGGPGQQQLGGLAAAAASHGHWGQAPQQPVGQSGHYGRR
ncbi:MCMA [Coprinopsis cinerea okayama7|uniref:MCMA n=1 Tax=Coprinopsis cinerea (strain Okayama-7 / 130 / ATCC MYA-4618 / FGSC 9003) TaxID=240176 RepID=A8NRA5_COPC7|nr:MCMA [Coprinopsis cinerea okayama7\|eukprot:XP_001835736.2 MCMA [Coprinopsis cinerea okayama7\